MLLKSQVYRSHNTPAGSYEVPPAPGSFHGDYAYGPYGSDFHGAPGFPEYGYPTEASWPSVEQGVCSKALGVHGAEGGPGAPGVGVCARSEEGAVTTRVGTGDGRAWASLPCKGAVPSAPVLRGGAYHAGPLVSWGCSLVPRPVHHTHFSTALPSGFLPSSAPHVEGQPPATRLTARVRGS